MTDESIPKTAVAVMSLIEESKNDVIKRVQKPLKISVSFDGQHFTEYFIPNYRSSWSAAYANGVQIKVERIDDIEKEVMGVQAGLSSEDK